MGRPSAKPWDVSEDVNLCVGHRHRVDVNVRRLGGQVADLDALYPLILDDVLDEGPHLRIGLEHLPDERPTRPRGEVVDRRGARRLGRGITRRNVGREELVGRLRHCPGQLLEVQAVVDDPACPNVDQSRVIGCCPKIRRRRRVEQSDRLRLPRNCSGAMYGSLPQSPVDMCIVVSHGKR